MRGPDWPRHQKMAKVSSLAFNFLRRQAYPAFCECLAVAGRPLLLSRAEDVTSQTAGRSCLVLAPHPDDETLGCGATLMRKVDAGTAVTVVVVSDGATWPPEAPAEQNIAVRDAELRASCRILGLPDEAVVHLSFPETQLDRVEADVADAV